MLFLFYSCFCSPFLFKKNLSLQLSFSSSNLLLHIDSLNLFQVCTRQEYLAQKVLTEYQPERALLDTLTNIYDWMVILCLHQPRGAIGCLRDFILGLFPDRAPRIWKVGHFESKKLLPNLCLKK